MNRREHVVQAIARLLRVNIVMSRDVWASLMEGPAENEQTIIIGGDALKPAGPRMSWHPVSWASLVKYHPAPAGLFEHLRKHADNLADKPT